KLGEPGGGVCGDGEDRAAHGVAEHHLAAAEGGEHAGEVSPGAQGEGGDHPGQVLALMGAEGPGRLGGVREARRPDEPLSEDPGTGQVSRGHARTLSRTVRAPPGHAYGREYVL